MRRSRWRSVAEAQCRSVHIELRWDLFSAPGVLRPRAVAALPVGALQVEEVPMARDHAIRRVASLAELLIDV